MRINATLYLFIILLCVTLIGVNCKKETAKVPLKPGKVQGAVMNEYGQLLSGAALTLQGSGVNSSKQAMDGRYSFDTLQPGSYNLTVRKEGYIETTATVVVAEDDTLTKDVVLKAGTAYFRLLSDTLITAKPFSSHFTIKIESNVSWSISNANSWVTPVSLNGNGNDSVRVNVAASTEDSIRVHTLIVRGGGVEKRIVIQQLTEVKLLQITALPGNDVKGIRDSISLLFNQPVTIFSNFPGYTFCQSDISYSYQGNRVTFCYACAAIGGEYPFSIATRNAVGDQYAFTFTAKFYENALKFTGTIKSYLVDDADNSYWVLTDHPNALYKINMSSLEILEKFDLPYEPVTFTISPYNQKIYISFSRLAKLYILNKSGTTEQIIDIAHDTTRREYEYDGPRIFPIRFAFTKNGKGMIWLSNTHIYGFSGFWFIDAADNHRIWYQQLPGELYNYDAVQTNFDHSKLVLTPSNEDPTIAVFDPEQMRFNNYKPTKFTRGFFNTASRKNGDIYSGQRSNQLIVNPATGFESFEMYRYLPYGRGSVDFNYQPGKEQVVYFSAENKVGVMDYKTRQSPVIYDANYFLPNVISTLDGKYVLMSGHDGNYNAKLVKISAAWFNY